MYKNFTCGYNRMSDGLKLRVIKKGMKSGGETKQDTYTPPRFLWRDANRYAELPVDKKKKGIEVNKKLKIIVKEILLTADL